MGFASTKWLPLLFSQAMDFSVNLALLLKMHRIFTDVTKVTVFFTSPRRKALLVAKVHLTIYQLLCHHIEITA